MKLLIFAALIAVVASKGVEVMENGLAQWEMFKIEYDKKYGSEDEEQYRQKIFMENYKFIKEHNKKYQMREVTFDVAINKFADMTNKEFSQTMNGLRIPVGPKRDVSGFVHKCDGLPSFVNWISKGAVTPIKDQGQCGSCWAFSATGSLEGQNFLKTKKLVSLSEQNLVDCSMDYGNNGCDGGLMDYAFEYIQGNNGIDTERSYPYKAKNMPCKYKYGTKGATCTGYVDLPQGDEDILQCAVAVVGPTSVAIDASQMTFQFYQKGIYMDPNCSCEVLDHGVLTVGYGTATTGEAYWMIKNSWGTSWGMKGYMAMARNLGNMCGIATMASFPTVSQ